jgi:two-component system response regulator AtoC
MGRRVEGFSADAEKKLLAHDWPGNVRELENAIERAFVVCESNQISAACLPFGASESTSSDSTESLSDVERRHIEKALIKNGWNISRVSRLLGIDRVTLYNKIRKYGIQRPEQG